MHEIFSGRVRTAVVLLLAFVVMAGTARAQSWWDGKWQYRKKISFNAAAKGVDIKDSLSDIPVLVRLHTGNFTFSNAKGDGTDIRFVASDDKSPLKFHIEKFDPTEEIALIWVKLPRLGGGGDDSIWMYYGNGSAADGQERGGTYDTAQAAVFHFIEKDGAPKDATSYGNNLTGTITGRGIPAVIGNGLAFRGPGQQFALPRSPSLNFRKGFTFSTWLRPASTSTGGRIYSWDDGSRSVVIGLEQGRVYCAVTDGGRQTAKTDTTSAIAPQSWHHLGVTADPGKKLTVYIDGRETASVGLPSGLPEPGADMAIGGSLKGDSYFAGDLDEIQISSVARPAGWMAAAFGGQGQDGGLVSYGDEETGGGGSESLTIHLISVVARTISLDGWLIIGVLAVLSALSWLIFVNKVILLRQTKRSNDAFADSFTGLADATSLYGNGQEDFRDSSLYRVYMAGCGELERLKDNHGGGRGTGYPAGTLDFLRATLKKSSIRESRRLTQWLFILTLCISGGPFLGLLGTVWGVMNTFAGMAEAGEANLTAIAPGVASALACTLAGLLVAIPALFAYSYLTGRLKEISAETAIFMDEFALKVKGSMGGGQ